MQGVKGSGIGLRLREARTHHGLSLTQVAEISGVHPDTVRACEGHRAQDVRVDLFTRASQAVGVDGYQLLRECGYEVVG